MQGMTPVCQDRAGEYAHCCGCVALGTSSVWDQRAHSSSLSRIGSPPLDQFCASMAFLRLSTVAITGVTRSRRDRAISSRWLLLRLSKFSLMKRCAATYSFSGWPPCTLQPSSTGLPSPRSTSSTSCHSPLAVRAPVHTKEVDGMAISPKRRQRLETGIQQCSCTHVRPASVTRAGWRSAVPTRSSRVLTCGSWAMRMSVIASGARPPSAPAPPVAGCAAPPFTDARSLQTSSALSSVLSDTRTSR
mmetsp:Transcript_13672/g.36601  ORF Transcript_13672/g.36601 Transcript_13672/m.36601 type:complete len:246 (+) Transcript_13672:186-923(+)